MHLEKGLLEHLKRMRGLTRGSTSHLKKAARGTAPHLGEVPAASLEWKAPSPCGPWLYPLHLLSLSVSRWWAWLPSQPRYSCANAHRKAKGSEGQPRNLFLVDFVLFCFFSPTSLDLQRTRDDRREFPYTPHPGSPTNHLVTHSPLVLMNEPC